MTTNSSEESEVRLLIERVQAGDMAAFDELYRRYKPLVFAVVLQRVRDEHLAEDLTADTFTRALAALPRLRWSHGFAGWLVTIAKNLVINHFRLARTRLVITTPRPGMSLVDERNAEAAPETTVVARTELLNAIRKLSPRQREVIVRRILLDRSVEQTAAELGWHESAVKHALRKAKRRLTATLLTAEATAA